LQNYIASSWLPVSAKLWKKSVIEELIEIEVIDEIFHTSVAIVFFNKLKPCRQKGWCIPSVFLIHTQNESP